MRFKDATIRHVRGWVDGIVERAEPDVTSSPRGVLEDCTNFFATPTGRLAVRYGSKVAVTLHKASGASMSQVLGVWPYTQTGAVAVAYHANAGTPENNLYRLTADLAFFGGVEATARHNLSWTVNTASAPRPVVAELFEKLYLCDAQTDYSLRNTLTGVTSAGVVASQTFAFEGGAAAAIKGYCLESYNGVLFVAGYAGETTGEEKAYLRHSFLGRDPLSATGFDKDAWVIVGSKGQRITAMKSGNNILIVAKTNELYRVFGTGRGLAGWQYQLAKLENTEGLGASNPYALCFAEGHWYGVSQGGPWRSNGETVEPIVGDRRDSWRKVTTGNLPTAWCAYHPERRAVLFGMHMTPVDGGRSATYPYTIWAYDIDRECWTGDQKFTADIAFGQAIPGAGTGGPSAAPSGLSITHANAVDTGGGPFVYPTWTNGDATADTEVWARYDTYPSTLYSTTAAGLTYVEAGATDGIQLSAVGWFGGAVPVKIRHTKNGLTTNFTAEVTAYTRPYGGAGWIFVNAPISGFPPAPTPGALQLDGRNFNQAPAVYKFYLNGVLFHTTATLAPQESYVTQVTGLVAGSYTLTIVGTCSSLPVGVQDSATFDYSTYSGSPTVVY